MFPFSSFSLKQSFPLPWGAHFVVRISLCQSIVFFEIFAFFAGKKKERIQKRTSFARCGRSLLGA
jgi:hypothetical protein